MAHLIDKTLLALGLALAASALCAVPAAAAEPKKAVTGKPKAKAAAKARAATKAAIPPEVPEEEPDITDNKITEFNCELGNKITVYANEADDKHIALRWKQRLHRLTRVGTTTGAQRFENPRFGLIWIGIPSNGMLLESKLNRQLANECKNAEQEKTVAGAPAAKPAVETPGVAAAKNS